MTNFIIPGLWEHYNVNIPFLGLLHNHPEYFYDEIKVSAVYGNFTFCTWDGGRIFPPTFHASYENIIRLKEIYNDIFQTPMRFIFTSSLVTPELYTDRFNNLVLSLCESDINEVVINEDGLRDYIHRIYPIYGLISSTTKCLTKSEDLLNELKNPIYKMVCWDYNLNKHQPTLDSIPEELKPKCEFLVNAICEPGCVYRKHHYYLNSVHSNSYGMPYPMGDCKIKGNNLIPFHYKNNLEPNEIFEYSEKGFINFKLEGRSFTSLEVILNLVKYMVKPEWQYAVILWLNNVYPEFDMNTFRLDFCHLI